MFVEAGVCVCVCDYSQGSMLLATGVDGRSDSIKMSDKQRNSSQLVSSLCLSTRCESIETQNSCARNRSPRRAWSRFQVQEQVFNPSFNHVSSLILKRISDQLVNQILIDNIFNQTLNGPWSQITHRIFKKLPGNVSTNKCINQLIAFR